MTNHISIEECKPFDVGKNAYSKPSYRINSCLAMKIRHIYELQEDKREELIRNYLKEQPSIIECINANHDLLLLASGITPTGYAGPKYSGYKLNGLTIQNRKSLDKKIDDLISIFSDSNDNFRVGCDSSQSCCLFNYGKGKSLENSLVVNQIQMMKNDFDDRLSKMQQQIQKSTTTTTQKQKSVSIKTHDGPANDKKTDNKSQPKLHQNDEAKLNKGLQRVIERQKEEIKQLKTSKKQNAKKKSRPNYASIASGNHKGDWAGFEEANTYRKIRLVRIWLGSKKVALTEDMIIKIADSWNIEENSLGIIPLVNNNRMTSFCVHFKTGENLWKKRIPEGCYYNIWKGGKPTPLTERFKKRSFYLGKISPDVSDNDVKNQIKRYFKNIDVTKTIVTFLPTKNTEKKSAFCRVTCSTKNTDIQFSGAELPFDIFAWRGNHGPKNRAHVLDKNGFNSFNGNGDDDAPRFRSKFRNVGTYDDWSLESDESSEK